jgi:HSP20 family molecular chaperone IbpA
MASDLISTNWRRFGSFVEKFRLADDCDPDRITAHYEGGILRIMLHKRPMAARHHAPGPRRVRGD